MSDEMLARVALSVVYAQRVEHIILAGAVVVGSLSGVILAAAGLVRSYFTRSK